MNRKYLYRNTKSTHISNILNAIIATLSNHSSCHLPKWVAIDQNWENDLFLSLHFILGKPSRHKMTHI